MPFVRESYSWRPELTFEREPLDEGTGAGVGVGVGGGVVEEDGAGVVVVEDAGAGVAGLGLVEAVWVVNGA